MTSEINTSQIEDTQHLLLSRELNFKFYPQNATYYQGRSFLDSSVDKHFQLTYPACVNSTELHDCPLQDNQLQITNKIPFYIFDSANHSQYLSNTQQIHDFQSNSSAQPSAHQPFILVKHQRRVSQRTTRNLKSKKYFDEDDDDQKTNRRSAKNQTKNIPKNYGKAIISFIEKNQSKVIQLLTPWHINFIDLLSEFKDTKRSINTIADLRNLWAQSKYAKVIRILSNLFMRKHSLHYIFNSRVSNFASHVKYRHKLREALVYPDNFKNIKDY